MRKPFGAAELRAKVAAHLRRERRPHAHALAFGEVRLDLGARELAVGTQAVPLSPTEYAICELLARHPGQVMSRAQIRETVLGWRATPMTRHIHAGQPRAQEACRGRGRPHSDRLGMGYKWQL